MDLPPPHPGQLLIRALEVLKLSQANLARTTGMSTKHINQICQQEAGVSARSAVLLEEATGIGAEVWMKLQAGVDLCVARVARRDKIEADKARMAAAAEMAAQAVAEFLSEGR